jgi:hypothetical protein
LKRGHTPRHGKKSKITAGQFRSGPVGPKFDIWS